MKVSRGEADQSENNVDVTADDVNTLSGLLEATALLLMGIQDGLAKVRLVYNLCSCSDLFSVVIKTVNFQERFCHVVHTWCQIRCGVSN